MGMHAGTLLNMLAVVLLGVSNTHDFNALPYGAVILGLAGMTFHLSQFHISNLFPRSRCGPPRRLAPGASRVVSALGPRCSSGKPCSFSLRAFSSHEGCIMGCCCKWAVASGQPHELRL